MNTAAWPAIAIMAWVGFLYAWNARTAAARVVCVLIVAAGAALILAGPAPQVTP